MSTISAIEVFKLHLATGCKSRWIFPQDGQPKPNTAQGRPCILREDGEVKENLDKEYGGNLKPSVEKCRKGSKGRMMRMISQTGSGFKAMNSAEHFFDRTVAAEARDAVAPFGNRAPLSKLLFNISGSKKVEFWSEISSLAIR